MKMAQICILNHCWPYKIHIAYVAHEVMRKLFSIFPCINNAQKHVYCVCVCWVWSMELNNYYTIVWIRLWWMCACLWSFPLKSNLIFHRPNFWKVAKKLYCIVYRQCTMQNLDHFSNLFGNLKTDTHAETSNIFRHCDRNASEQYVCVYVRSAIQRQNLNINIHLYFAIECATFSLHGKWNISMRCATKLPETFKYAFIGFNSILDFRLCTQCTCTQYLLSTLYGFWI